ncbi:hypothetical protein O7632_25015 [Solwaraspora sp. WMMD406]|nr:hypothetical protein [Solwaraspora sp. WMMD406]MDG4767327.1 hypothetical protein [Solwaraspora sp. WMMD406]
MSHDDAGSGRPGWWSTYRGLLVVVVLVVLVLCFLWCAGVAAFRVVQGG